MRKNIVTACLVVFVFLCSHNAQALYKPALFGSIGLGVSVAGLVTTATVLGIYMQDNKVNGYSCGNGILSSNAQAVCCDVVFPSVSNCVAQNPSARPPCGSKTAVCRTSNGGYEYATATYTSEAQTAQIVSGVFLAVSVLAGLVSTGVLIRYGCHAPTSVQT